MGWSSTFENENERRDMALAEREYERRATQVHDKRDSRFDECPILGSSPSNPATPSGKLGH
jgi:hypothetical protein